MDRSHSRSGNTTHIDCKGTQKIVDDPKSSNPHSLLPWLKRQLYMFAPMNNADYIPPLPPAA